MTRNVKGLVLLCLIVVALPVAAKLSFDANHPSGTWRYKVTVEIETPEGVKSGSAVHELSVATPLIDLPDVGNPASIRGEAVVVDLGKRGVVFALMSDQSWENGLYQAFPTEAPSSDKGIAYYRKTLKVGMKAEWKGYDHQPRFVTFSDLNDPKSVMGVRSGNMAAVFGEGVRFKRITVEITNEPVTRTRVDEYLKPEFWQSFRNWMHSVDMMERGKYVHLFRFKEGTDK